MLLQTNGDTNLQAQQVVVMLPAAQIKAREINDALPMPVIFKTEHRKNILQQIESCFLEPDNSWAECVY